MSAVLIVWTLAVLSLGFTLGALSHCRAVIVGAAGLTVSLYAGLGYALGLF